MLTLNVVLHRSRGPIDHQTINLFGADVLTPTVARKALAAASYDQGTVYQYDHIDAQGRLGTLAYRVYNSGRCVRSFYEYTPDIPF
jgi:hypothetical protein